VSRSSSAKTSVARANTACLPSKNISHSPKIGSCVQRSGSTKRK
jgi:hypothetical protein